MLFPLLLVAIAVLSGCVQNISQKTTTQNSINVSSSTKLPMAEVVFNLEKGKEWYGDVYYIDRLGNRKLIAKSQEGKKVSEEGTPEGTIHYTKAKLSLNEKFIAMIFECWEVPCLHVYAIETGKIHEANQADFEVKWLNDNRLRIDGPCDINRACGVFESVDNKQPWIFREVEKKK